VRRTTAFQPLLWIVSREQRVGGVVLDTGSGEVVSFPFGRLSRHGWATLGEWTRAVSSEDGAEFCVFSESSGDSAVDFDRIVLRVKNDPFVTYVIYRPACYPRWVTVTPDAVEEGVVRETHSLREALNAIRPALPEVTCTVLPFRRDAA